MGSAASLECWDASLIPGLAQLVKDPGLQQLWHGSQVWFASDPWPGNSYAMGRPKQTKKKRNQTNIHVIKQNEAEICGSAVLLLQYQNGLSCCDKVPATD